MRNSRLYILAFSGLAGIFLWVGLAWGQSSSSFQMEKSTIDGGGGGMASGSFVLQGTTGQMEAGSAQASSSSYRLAGGFWPQAAPEPEETSTPDPGETPTPDPNATPTPEGGGEDQPPSLFLPILEGD